MSQLVSQTDHLKKPNCCPNKKCQSPDIDGDSIKVDGGSVWQKVSCNECETVWNDVYTLTSYEVLEEPEVK